MNNLSAIGRYLSRAVKVANIADETDIAEDALRSSVVLVFLARKVTKDSLVRLIRSLIAGNPLAVAIAGEDSEAVFDALIAELSDGKARPHVMTRHMDGPDLTAAIEELLQGTWPSDERFDDWSDYTILSLGGDRAAIERAVKELCK